MPTTYSLATPDVTADLSRVMARYHPRLKKADVKVGILFATNPDGPAVKSGGYPVLASIKPVSLKDRVSKDYDAELVIDAHEWQDLRPGQQAALLDHELSHIDTIDNEDSADEKVDWKTDDLGRPKLKSVRGDWSAGDGFAQVIARHGGDAIEYECLTRCMSRANAARRAGETGQDV